MEINQFNGLRNTTQAERFADGDLAEAVNVDLDDTKHLKRRDGQTLKLDVNAHSLWSNGEICLFVSDGALKRLHTDYSEETLRTGITDLPMAYVSVIAGTVYYSNGVEKGVIQNGTHRSWGMQPPELPAVSETTGYLTAGTYLYALTFLRQDGQESGAQASGQIELLDNAGIVFSNIPSHPEADKRVIYLSAPNGEKLYRALTIPADETTATVTANRSVIGLITQFCQPPPAGHILAEYNGRIYVGRDNVLYPSEPYQHELFQIDRNFLPFVSRLTLVAPVASGMFVATEKSTVFLGGGGPEVFTHNHRADYGAIPGTLAYVDGQYVGDGIQGNVAVWASPMGTCIGLDDGTFRNLTGSRFRYGNARAGAGIYRQNTTLNQYILSLLS